MDICPICRKEVSIEPPEWSGGRLVVKCSYCGPYEIGLKIYDELLILSESHWQIERLRDGIERLSPPVKIEKATTNIIEVHRLDEKLTRMRKKHLRKEAEEGGPKISGKIFHPGEEES